MSETLDTATALDLDYSIPFNHHIWTDHSDVNAMVDDVFSEHFVTGRKWRIQKRHLKSILLNLYYVWANDPNILIAFHRNRNDYSATSMYVEHSISSLTIEIVNTLIDKGFIESRNGFYDRRQGGSSRVSRVKPLEPLITAFEGLELSTYDISFHMDRVAVILRDDGKKDMEYEPNENTERMESMLGSYNELLRRTFIDIPHIETPIIRFNDNRPEKYWSLNQQFKFVRRIFNNGSLDFDKGGRFYGGWWQSCPKEMRDYIYINGSPTNEIDFKGLHIVMLYALEGLNYFEIFEEADPYIFEVPEFAIGLEGFRDSIKSLFLIMINASDRNNAIAGYKNKFRIESSVIEFNVDQLNQLLDCIDRAHPQINQYFNSGMGVNLQFLDSQISEIILVYFMSKGIPILCIHDSYIVPKGCENELIEIMKDTFNKVMRITLTDTNAIEETSRRLDELSVQERRETIEPEESERYREEFRRFLLEV